MATIFWVLRALVIVNLLFFAFQIWFLTSSNRSLNPPAVDFGTSDSVARMKLRSDVRSPQSSAATAQAATVPTATLPVTAFHQQSDGNKLNGKGSFDSSLTNHHSNESTFADQTQLQLPVLDSSSQKRVFGSNEEHRGDSNEHTNPLSLHPQSTDGHLLQQQKNTKQLEDAPEEHISHLQNHQNYQQEQLQLLHFKHDDHEQQHKKSPEQQDHERNNIHEEQWEQLQNKIDQREQEQEFQQKQQQQQQQANIQFLDVIDVSATNISTVNATGIANTLTDHASSSTSLPSGGSSHKSSPSGFSTTEQGLKLDEQKQQQLQQPVPTTKLEQHEQWDFPVSKPPSNYDGLIFMDWVADSDEFGPMNYKSLESLLLQYPNASIRVHLIGPIEIELYKVGNLMSRFYFHKYQKQGYRIEFVPMYENYTVNAVAKNLSAPVGYSYWDAQFVKCCWGSLQASKMTNRQEIPLHLYFYRRVLALYQHGGMFSDFSWYHRQPLDMFTDHQLPQQQQQSNGTAQYHGWVMKEVCRPNVVVTETGGIQEMQQQPSRCFTSTLMAFSSGSVVLQCMLQKYDTRGSRFRQCLTRADRYYSQLDDDGSSSSKHRVLRVAECISLEISDCFNKHDLRNDFWYIDDRGEGDHNAALNTATTLSTETVSGNVTSLLRTAAAAAPRERMNRALQVHGYGSKEAAAYLAHHAAVSASSDCASWWEQMHFHAARFSFSNSSSSSSSSSDIRWKHAVNMAELCGDWKADAIAVESSYHERWHTTVQWQPNCTACSSSSISQSMLESVLHSDVLWLGTKAAYNVEWNLPAAGSLFDSILKQRPFQLKAAVHRLNVLHYDVTDTRRLRLDHLVAPPTGSVNFTDSFDSHPVSSLLLSDSHETHLHASFISGENSSSSTDIVGNLFEGEAFALQAFERPYTRWDPVSGLMRKYIAVQQPPCHHYKLPDRAPLPWKRQASDSCAPLFMIPGFMKAGTTALFGAIMTHPQMVYNLRGVSFKETGCYRKMHGRTERMKCFPYIQPHEHLYFGDGTVLYADLWKLASFIAEDNPDVKVIFSIRDPVKRTESHHRFVYGVLRKHGMENMNVAIQRALNRSEGTLMTLYDHAVDAVREKDPVLRQEKTEYLIEQFFTEPPEPTNPLDEGWVHARYLITHSIYLPAIYNWYKSLPSRRNIMVVRTEDYNPRKLSSDAKLSYLRQVLDLPHEFKTFKQQFDAEAAAAQNSSSAAIAAVAKKLDDKYLIEKMNTLYRFLGVSPVMAMSSYNLHETGSKKMPQQNRMTAGTANALRDFFAPFEVLLQEFLSKMRSSSKQ